jgi:8-oxo-dGTP diphosphatase
MQGFDSPLRLNMKQDKMYFIGLKAFVVKNKCVLILQGSNKMEREGLWGLPGGRIQDGEEDKTLQEILLREVHEECGENFVISIGSPSEAWRFEIPGKNIVLIGYMCKYESGEVILSPEHKDYKWLSKNDSIGAFEFVPGYKEVIERVLSKI